MDIKEVKLVAGAHKSAYEAMELLLDALEKLSIASADMDSWQPADFPMYNTPQELRLLVPKVDECYQVSRRVLKLLGAELSEVATK